MSKAEQLRRIRPGMVQELSETATLALIFVYEAVTVREQMEDRPLTIRIAHPFRDVAIVSPRKADDQRIGSLERKIEIVGRVDGAWAANEINDPAFMRATVTFKKPLGDGARWNWADVEATFFKENQVTEVFTSYGRFTRREDGIWFRTWV